MLKVFRSYQAVVFSLIAVILSEPLVAHSQLANSEVLVIQGKAKKTVTVAPKTELLATNQHPAFVKAGPQKYQGLHLKDLLADQPPKKEVLFLDESGVYYIALHAEEAVFAGNLLASHKNGSTIDRANCGLQVIYSAETLKQYPHLNHRNYWIWWVKTLIIGSEVYPHNLQKLTTQPPSLVNSIPPFPQMYGRSSYIEKNRIFAKNLREISLKPSAKELKVSQIAGRITTVPVKSSLTYFVEDFSQERLDMVAGGISLYIASKDTKGTIISFEQSFHFIDGLEVMNQHEGSK